MSKANNTLLLLKAALQRILQGQTNRIPANRKLSIRAVEEEAGLGNGSGYYYPEFVEKVRQAKSQVIIENGALRCSDTERLRDKAKQQTRVKEKYKQEKDVLKNLVVRMAAEHHHFSDSLRKAYLKMDELTKENQELKNKLVELRRKKIVDINSLN